MPDRPMRTWTLESAGWTQSDLEDAVYEALTNRPMSGPEVADVIGARHDLFAPFRLVALALRTLLAEGLVTRASARGTYRKA